MSARRLDPRRRRAETGFAAGLDWDGVKRASARLSQVAFCVSPGPFFFKRIGKLRIVRSLSEQTGAHLSTRGWLSASSAAKKHMHNTAMFDQPACPPLARSSSKSSPGRSKTSKPAALAALSARFSTDELMDCKLPGKHGQGRSQQAAPPHFGVELADRSQQAAPPHGVELATEQQVQQVAPPLSGVEQTEPKDKIAARFDESMRSLEAFSGELLHKFRHRLSRGKASSPPA